MDKNIVNEVKAVDYALLDGTFYSNSELPAVSWKKCHIRL